MSYATVIRDEALDLAKITEKDVRLVFIVKLPFRLRVGTLHRFQHGPNIELIFRNRIDLPEGTT